MAKRKCVSAFFDPAQEDGRYSKARAKMVRDQLAGRGINDTRVLAAMGKIPRQLFVPGKFQSKAYEDGPLPIAANQTISQPYIVGLITQLLQLSSEDRVLEIGAGSGYQAAVLAEIAREVLAVERIEELAQGAANLLAWLGYSNVQVYHGDGTEGLPAFAPYDAILVSAASPTIPPPLLDQLAVGGRLVIPVGVEKEQYIERVFRHEDRLEHETLIEVRFVPLVGRYGAKP